MFLGIVFLLSAVLVAVPLAVSGQIWLDLSLLAGCTALASLILIFRESARSPQPRTPKRQRKPARRPVIVIDGSNVMHWKDEVPKIETVREVVATLKARGFEPGVVFDANAGYKVMDRYLDDRPLARMLKLPVDRVLVVPKGSPADPVILLAARDQGAQVVTNDRYRDHVANHPEVLEPGKLVRGGYRDGKLWLELDAMAA